MHSGPLPRLDYPQEEEKQLKKRVDNKNDADDDDENENESDKPEDVKPFKIGNPGDCTSENQYGYPKGKPCVLVKMNKVNLLSFDRIMARGESPLISRRSLTSYQVLVCQTLKKLHFKRSDVPNVREYPFIAMEK